ncbi:MAG: hypothetical protein CVV24_02870 [Ignavibacteriae bacterium HGW-Ignavibacteriae-3]|nr:MAG: hypothetical protein CVV24_02870 [Ignavibacteriae bacterium HGW-Ignavibacteriae-3]
MTVLLKLNQKNNPMAFKNVLLIFLFLSVAYLNISAQEGSTGIQGLRCAYCGKIISGEFIIFENKKYHESCCENYVIPKCAICDKPLRGTYNIDTYGNKFHKEHSSELAKCEICSRLICQQLTGGGKKYNDGRNICNVCFRLAVFEQYKFKQLLSSVSSRLASFGIYLDMKKVSISGVDKIFLMNKFKGSGDLGQGYCDSQTKTQYENNKLINTSTFHMIYVLNGVPEIVVASTIAHELMHAWIVENAKENHSEEIIEGSCNYVSYLYLKSINDPSRNDQIKNLEKNPDPVYGDGFKLVRAKFEGRPVQEFLRFLKK